MTSAARPTFAPALGGNNLSDRLSSGQGGKGGVGGPGSERYSSKDQQSHGKIKLRSSLQKRGRIYSSESSNGSGRELGEKLRALAKRIEFHDDDGGGGEESSRNVGLASVPATDLETVASDNGTETSSDDDDEADLRQELAYLQSTRQEKLKLQEEQELISSNPLLNHFDGTNVHVSGESYRVKQRWDSDVVFKRQRDDWLTTPKTPFVNDMVRSEFHKRFMKKYIQ